MRYCCYIESDSRKWNNKEISLLRYVYLRALSMYACGSSADSIAFRLAKVRVNDANSANEQQVQDKSLLSAVVTNEANLVPKLTQPDRFGVC